MRLVDTNVSLPCVEPLESVVLLCAQLPVPLVALPSGEAMPGVAVMEAEAGGGATNNDIASAQSLQFRRLQPWLGMCGARGPQQAAISGVADGAVAPAARVTVAYDESQFIFGAICAGSPITLNFTDAIVPGTDATLNLTAFADLAGPSKYLSVSVDGVSLGNVFVDNGLTNAEVSTSLTISRDVLTPLVADGVITITLTPSAAMTVLGGTSYAMVGLSYGPVSPANDTASTSDYYKMDLAAGDSISLAVSGLSGGAMELLDSSGAVVATGVAGAENAGLTIADFHPAAAGTYYVRIAGQGEYGLVADRNATMDLEYNSDAASAQVLATSPTAGRQWAIGRAGLADSDFYAVTLSGNQLLKVAATSASRAIDVLHPVLRLYDAGGNVVATGKAGPAGLASWLQFRTAKGAADATYYMEVTSATDAGGSYVLTAMSKGNSAHALQAHNVQLPKLNLPKVNMPKLKASAPNVSNNAKTTSLASAPVKCDAPLPAAVTKMLSSHDDSGTQGWDLKLVSIL